MYMRHLEEFLTHGKPLVVLIWWLVLLQIQFSAGTLPFGSLCSFPADLCCPPTPRSPVSIQGRYLLSVWERLGWPACGAWRGLFNTVLISFSLFETETCSFTVGRIPWGSLLPWTISEKQRDSCTGMTANLQVDFPMRRHCCAPWDEPLQAAQYGADAVVIAAYFCSLQPVYSEVWLAERSALK